jgi:hypothetical protein
MVIGVGDGAIVKNIFNLISGKTETVLKYARSYLVEIYKNLFRNRYTLISLTNVFCVFILFCSEFSQFVQLKNTGLSFLRISRTLSLSYLGRHFLLFVRYTCLCLYTEDEVHLNSKEILYISTDRIEK